MSVASRCLLFRSDVRLCVSAVCWALSAFFRNPCDKFCAVVTFHCCSSFHTLFVFRDGLDLDCTGCFDCVLYVCASVRVQGPDGSKTRKRIEEKQQRECEARRSKDSEERVLSGDREEDDPTQVNNLETQESDRRRTHAKCSQHPQAWGSPVQSASEPFIGTPSSAEDRSFESGSSQCTTPLYFLKHIGR